MMDTRQVRSRTISNLSGAAVLIICFCFYVLEMLKVGPLSSWLCSLIVAHLGKDDWQVGGKVPYRRAAKRPSARSRITIPSTTPASIARRYAQYCRCFGERITKFARKTSSSWPCS
ncbi:hypothetical protein HBI52_009160 [Parastagonospora nodorum]|nr:hypothetical protein HBH52_038890 [Parastagonospora nodorum]KAH4060855.1 hypothetical protein HBH49_007510 [Parastagonospora nodorum]KAH4274323.1 hypothetical protein HBI03_013120 [Parastagonospora nodorum]KAH5532837.1 hypothetical protein HBI52_009160 [Parastagonospora nodorum]KAH6189468.1 hypothetical protein HBI61_014970 [Parastagonospora nodorum]